MGVSKDVISFTNSILIHTLYEILEVTPIGVHIINTYFGKLWPGGGKSIKEISIDPGKPGKNFITTLDLDVQKLSSELLKGKSGSVCVMDIYTGEIVAMHSSPSFDPNLFVFGISQDDWQLIRNDPMKPLVNKTLQGNYSPGSTIKPIVCLLYTSPSPRDATLSRMPSSA